MLCVCVYVLGKYRACAARATMDTVCVCVGVSLVPQMRVTHVSQRTHVYAFRWALLCFIFLFSPCSARLDRHTWKGWDGWRVCVCTKDPRLDWVVLSTRAALCCACGVAVGPKRSQRIAERENNKINVQVPSREWLRHNIVCSFAGWFDSLVFLYVVRVLCYPAVPEEFLCPLASINIYIVRHLINGMCFYKCLLIHICEYISYICCCCARVNVVWEPKKFCTDIVLASQLNVLCFVFAINSLSVSCSVCII